MWEVFNFNGLVHFTKTKQEVKNKTKQNIHRVLLEPSQNLLPGLDTTVSLLGGSILPPEHVLPPRPVSDSLPSAAPCFPARPSAPSQQQTSQSSRTGTKAGPVSFLLLLSTYQRGRRGLCCRTPFILCLSTCPGISSCSSRNQTLTPNPKRVR